jgi:hypothetical protein
LPEIKNLGMIAETTAKFMDTLERTLGDMEEPQIVHVCVVADVRYKEDGDDQSHVILETDVDDRIVQIGITTSAQAAALFGETVGGDE